MSSRDQHYSEQVEQSIGPVYVLVALLTIQLPTGVPRKAAEDGLSAWVSATHMRGEL